VLLPTFDLDLSALPDDEQFPAWASHVANSKASRLPPLTGPFRSHTKFWRLDPLLISEQWMDPFAFERDEAMVRATAADHYSLVVILDGQIVLKRPDGDLVCGAGDATLTDLTRPELMHAGRHHSVMIQVARWFLDEALDPVDIHGRLPRTPATRVLVDFVAALVPQLGALPAVSALPMARVLRDLLATCLAELPPRDTALEGRQPIRHRVRAYIEQIPRGALNVDAMCLALGVTRSSLNRAFKAAGGVMAYDRRRRLVALHGRLADATETRSVSQLGYDYGFPEKSHLSRVFREAFGYPPSDVRKMAAAHLVAAAPAGSLQATYKAALRELS
jgi:AraC-like DNA-binding protein